MRLLILLALVASPTIGLPPTTPDDFRMIVADVFAITGTGIVVTGVVEGGPVRVNDTVCLRPAEGEPRELTVEGIEMFRRVLEVAEPGQAVGLLFTEIERDDVAKDDVLTASCG